MLVTEHANKTLSVSFLLLVNLLSESFFSIVFVNGFNHCVVFYFLTGLPKNNWLVVLASNSLKNCLVDEGARADARLEG